MPLSVGGNAPAVVQAQAVQTFYNRPLSLQVAAARESARAAGFDSAARRDQSIFEVANLHLGAARSARLVTLVRQQIESLTTIASAVRARVQEGRELPIEARAADFRIAQAKQRLRALETEQDQNETALAIALGFPPDDRVRPLEQDLPKLEMPQTEGEAARDAMDNSKVLRRFQASLQARQLEANSGRAARYPKIELVSQYALAAKFNNYEDLFP